MVEPLMRAGNALLALLLQHDVYRINEDRGGLELLQLQQYAAALMQLAARFDSSSTSSTSSSSSSGALDSSHALAAQYLQAFSMRVARITQSHLLM
jgi:hypothetical protein